MLFIAHDDVVDLFDVDEIVAAVREGYRQRGEGAAAKPRQKLFRSDPDGMFTGYAAILPDTGVMGGYMYAAGFGAEDAWFATPLFDAETGEPIAILDGAAMNPYKTGAAGAVAVDELAHTDASVAAIIGSGVQARGQLIATASVREFESVRVYSPTRSHRESFADEFDDRLEASVTAVDRSADAVEDADVVITATTASEPVFDGSVLAPGAHVTAMGQYHPRRREVDVETVRRSTYVPDLRERATYDAGAFRTAMESGAVSADHIHAELGEIVAGRKPGRTSSSEVTLFDSGGTGIETVAAAAYLYERARELGRGTRIEFAPASEAMAGR